MSLDLASLLPQLEAMGQTTARRAQEHAELMPRVKRALKQAAQQPPEELRERVRRAGDRWSGAEPTREPVDASIAAPPLPERLTVLGADGSQVEPDRHAPALFYLINIGSIALTIGSTEPPSAHSHPTLHFEDEDLHPQDAGLIPSEFVKARRDIAELGELARLAQLNAGEETLALLDNGLLLWLALQARELSSREVERALDEYYSQLSALHSAQAAVAGFVDRPQNGNVLALLHLASLPVEAINEDTVRANPFRRLSDRELFADLLPAGYRSALFVHVSPVNQAFSDAGHPMHFFYLNTGPQAQIARVEIPGWVAEDARLLARVHAGILQQCQTTGGFPYALVRAHELAVVGPKERQALEETLSDALLRAGIFSRRSLKSQTKRWTTHPRRHRL